MLALTYFDILRGEKSRRGTVKRIAIESKLNESRNLLMATYAHLTNAQLRRPVTTSEYDADNH